MEMRGVGPGRSGRDDALARSIAVLRAWVATLTLALAAVAVWAALEARSTPAVLSAERLEIVEAGGEPAIVLSNSQRVPPATMDGHLLLADQAEERRGAPGIIFFDGKGDEVGGLTFGNREAEDGFSATRHFSLDAYKHDQTVVVHHYQSPEGATTGVSISDRPWDRSILDALSALGLEPAPTRAELNEAIENVPEEGRAERLRELFGVERLFLGSDANDDALLLMRDARERPRLRIVVPREGEPSITILGEEGDVVARLP